MVDPISPLVEWEKPLIGAKPAQIPLVGSLARGSVSFQLQQIQNKEIIHPAGSFNWRFGIR